MSKKGLDIITQMYEKKKELLSNEYQKKLEIVNKLPFKKQEKRKNKIDNWYKSTLLRYNRRVEKRISNKIYISKLRLQLKKYFINIDENMDKIYVWLENHTPYLTFFPKLLIKLIFLIYRIVIQILYYIFYPVIYLIKLVFPYIYIRYFLEFYFEFIRKLKRPFSKVEDYIEDQKKISHHEDSKRLLISIRTELVRMINEDINEISHTEFDIIDENSTLNEAISIINQKSLDRVFVTSGDEIIGVLELNDIINAEIRLGVLDTKIIELCDKNLHKTNDDISIKSAMLLMVKNDKRYILQGEKNPYRLISITDILKFIDIFNQKNNIDIVDIKKAHEIINNKTVSLAKTEKIQYARTIMNEKNIGMIILTDNNKPVGAFTSRDYLSELDKGIERVRQTRLEAVMEVNLPYVNSYDNIFVANSKVLEKGKQLIKRDGEIIGVITEVDLLKSFNDLFDSIIKIINN